MRLELNINEIKANIFLEFLEIFKKDNIVDNYKIIDVHNDYEKEILEDLGSIDNTILEDGFKTDKYIEINDIK